MPVNTLAFPFRRHALAMALALLTGAAEATIINVGGSCTLINAVNNANSDTDTDGINGCVAGSGADTLKLAANKIYTLTAEDNYANGEGENALPSVTSVITVNGNNATLQRADAADTPDFRLFHVADSGTLTINNLTLKNGNLSAYYLHGGAILNRGSLTLTNSTVVNNRANNGGGIANLDGILTLINSNVSGNQAIIGGGIETLGNAKGGTGLFRSHISGNKAIIGGGIFNDSTSVSISDSTFDNNKAGREGGALVNNKSTVTLTNSTVSGNQANMTGGGIINSNKSSLTVTNSTVSGNKTAVTGSAIINSYNSSLSLTHATIANNGGKGVNNQSALLLVNSLIVNSAAEECLNTGFTLLKGGNLIEDGSCGASLNGAAKLGLLLDNGGVTLTHALFSLSPALNASDTLCSVKDQRGIGRSQPRCDLGAFERVPDIPASVAATVQFFDDQLQSGGIQGISPFPQQRAHALRNQLLTAGYYKDSSQTGLACNQLSRTLQHIDTDNTPDSDDYVTGNQAAALAAEINTLSGLFSCP